MLIFHRVTLNRQHLINSRKHSSSAPILAYPDHEGEFIVDASNYAIGAVLTKVQDGKERVIMYGSKGFSFYLQGREFTL